MTKIFLDTFDEGKDRMVTCGYIEGKTYYRDVTNAHFMVKYNGYGIQEDIMSKLLKAGVTDIRIKTQAGTTHKVTLVKWLKNGKKDKYGHGKQIFLDVKFMEKSK